MARKNCEEKLWGQWRKGWIFPCFLLLHTSFNLTYLAVCWIEDLIMVIHVSCISGVIAQGGGRFYLGHHHHYADRPLAMSDWPFLSSRNSTKPGGNIYIYMYIILWKTVRLKWPQCWLWLTSWATKSLSLLSTSRPTGKQKDKQSNKQPSRTKPILTSKFKKRNRSTKVGTAHMDMHRHTYITHIITHWNIQSYPYCQWESHVISHNYLFQSLKQKHRKDHALFLRAAAGEGVLPSDFICISEVLCILKKRGEKATVCQRN